MKHEMKRLVSVFMVFAMIVTLFAGSFTVSAAETYNWGTRDEVCTELSSQAEAYYTGSYTYSSLSNLSGSSLLSSLRTLTTNTHRKQTSYDNCRDYAYRSDCQNGDGTVVLFYTSYVAQQSDYSGTAPGWNREHVWPKALGGFQTSGPGADMHHIRPDDVTTNSKRGSNKFGEVSGGTSATGSALVNGMSGGTYGGGYFEPLDNVKGDVARICLYMHVRYGGSGSYNCDDITNVFSDVNTLLSWMELDPVDTWEMGRNDVVEGIQGNRNPFIDFPELAWLLYNKQIPSDLISPSGGSAPSYEITAVSNNTTYGTVSLVNSTITAYPKAGCYVSGYTVTSGTATVTQEGNTFRVKASSDCTIRINFAAKTTAVVTFVQNGVAASTKSGYSEDVITLPSHSGTLPTGHKFVGWVKKTVSQTTSKPAQIYTAGTDYTLTSSETLYALYSRTDANGSGTVGEYTLFTGTLTEGDYLIVYSNGAMRAADDNGRLAYTDVTIVDDTINEPESDLIWHIAPTSDGYYTIYNEANGVYAAGNGTKNKASLVTSVDNHAKWTASATGTDTYEFVNLENKNSGVNANLRRNGTYGFACYSTTTGNALSLYQGISGTTYYTTSATVCAHSNTKNVAAVAATCTAVGYTAGVYCNDCKTYISGHSEIAMTEHPYGSWKSNNSGSHTKTCASCGDAVTKDCEYNAVVTEPTATQQGYTTYTCTVCNYSYVGDYTAALGYPQTINFSVPAGVTKPASQSAYAGSTITLPTPTGSPSADAYTYKFVGWVEASVQETTAKPTVYAAGSSYTVTSGKTLYALYSYSISGSGNAGGFELVTSEPSSWAGEYVLTSQDASYVFLADGTTPNTVNAAVTIGNTGISLDGTTMSNVSDNYIIVIEAVDNVYSMRLKGASDTLYLMTSNSNSGFNTATSTTNDTALWTISLESDGGVLISNVGYTSRDLRFNSGSKQFRTYTSGQGDIYLYAGSSATMYYTTSPEGATVCPHTSTSKTTNNATCTQPGKIIVTCTNCGEVISETAIPALGHSYTYKNNGDNHSKTCVNGGETVTEAHSYVNGKCVCGATETTEPKLVYNSNLTLTMSIGVGAEMQVFYTVLNSKVKSYQSFYVEVVKNVAGGQPVKTIFSVAEGNMDPFTNAAGSITRYMATYTGIAAKEMGDSFTATLYAVAADGTINYGPSETSSIKDYLMEQIDLATSSAELKTLAVDMLHYGAAAQINFAYDTANLVNSDLTAAQLALGTQEEPSAVNGFAQSASGCRVNTSVSIGSKVELYLTFIYKPTASSKMELRIKNAKGDVIETLTPDYTVGANYRAVYDNVGAKQMRDLITIELYDNGTLVSKSTTWSVETYVAQVIENTASAPELVNVCKAMLTYGDAAAVYLEASGQ